ncbi:MAG: hypothetical protein ACI4FZ_00380 [Lachnospiraceae bacterium]
MKHAKRITAALLALLLIMTLLPVSASAAQENTPKEEVVYINLKADGSVKEINVVNIFDLSENGKIIDYGTYESLRNMTTTDTIHYQNDMVTIDAGAGKLYYEGKLKENAMPWTISIKYFMDGREYSADDIAGMSGKLEIKMTIRQNRNCDSSFFDGYALQTTFTLDTHNAANITAEGATIANVGSDKQITYTILPNSERDISISADVKNFEMNGISINGIRMNLDIDIDDATLQEKIDEVIGAVNDLDEGAGKLNDGASDLYDATGKLNSAVGELYTGTGSLHSGSVELKNGLDAVSSKNSELTGAAWTAYEGLCTAAQTQLNAKLSENGLDTVTLNPVTYSETLLGVLAKLDADTVYNTVYQAALAEVTAQVAAEVSALKGQLDSYGAFYRGLVDYTNAVSSAANGANELTDGIQSLYTNTSTLKNAVGDIHIAVGTLKDGTNELKDGTEAFILETADMDTKVSDEINSITSSLTGKDVETVSFVSEQNTNIKSVQFVIQTESIEIAESVEAVVEEVEELTFWQKLLRLFGLY